MTMTDPIADMLTRIRNALMAGHKRVDIPYSKVTHNIADVLVREGMAEQAEHKGRHPAGKVTRVSLAYDEADQPRISAVERVSRPGQRIYRKAGELQSVMDGYGFAIVSTPQGLMTDKEARKNNIGGEVLCNVW